MREQTENKIKEYALACARAYIYSSQECRPFVITMADIGVRIEDAVRVLAEMASMTCIEIEEKYGFLGFTGEFDIIMAKIEDVYFASYNNTSVRKERESRIKICELLNNTTN